MDRTYGAGQCLSSHGSRSETREASKFCIFLTGGEEQRPPVKIRTMYVFIVSLLCLPTVVAIEHVDQIVAFVALKVL
jgi:hypothetical protein